MLKRTAFVSSFIGIAAWVMLIMPGCKNTTTATEDAVFKKITPAESAEAADS